MLKYVKMILLVGVLGAAMSGCVDSDDPDFQIAGKAYVIQKNNEYGGGKQFGTYAAIVASYGTVQDISFMRNGYDLKFLYKLGEGIYETRYMTWGSLSDCNGDYVISAQDEKGNVEQSSFSLKIEKELGDLTITEPLEYKGDRFTAQWKKVDNATGYAILIGMGVKDGELLKFYRINSGYYPWTTITNQNDNISATLSRYETIPNIALNTELMVAIVAVCQSTGGNLYLEGNYYKIVVGQDGITPIDGFN